MSNQGEGGTWAFLKGALREQLNEQAYATWVSQMACLQDDGKILKIGLPDSFSLNWVNDHYRDILEGALTETGVQLELAVSPPDAKPELLTEAPPPPPVREESTAGGDLVNAVTRDRLNARYLFSSFVVGPSNQLAWSAAKSVTEHGTPTYSPLVIVGGVGLGKTHLLHAIAHEVLTDKKKPKKRVLLKTSEQFITDVVQGVRTQRMEEVRRLYRDCDFLLIDDIQFISGKAVCQEEFFHTFNTLYDAQKQIVVTSDRLPHEISDVQERVRNRFAWGLIADLKVPELATRVQILAGKAEADSINIDEAVLTFLAQSIRSNVRELEGSLIRVHAYASLTRQPLTVSLARDVLKDVISDTTRVLTCEQVVKAVSNHFDVKVTDMKSSKRARAIAFPRQVSMYLCRRHTDSSYPEIGQALGGKDHSTAINAYKKITEKLSDPKVRQHIEEIERSLLE